MQLELLALPLMDADTAVAVIGLKQGDKATKLYEVPLAYSEITTEKVLGVLAELQTKTDALRAIKEACQPKLVVAGANVTVGGFGRLN